MTPEEKKTMIAMAKQLDLLTSKVAALETGTVSIPKKPLTVAPQHLPPSFSRPIGNSDAFFGKPSQPTCSVTSTFKTGVEPRSESIAAKEVEKGQMMLRQAVLEFCEEFDLKEFNLSYLDNSPAKKKSL